MFASQRAPSSNGGSYKENVQGSETRGHSPEPFLQTAEIWGLSWKTHHPLKAWHLKLTHYLSSLHHLPLHYLWGHC